ncbi:MAG: hypothetical protein ACYTXT_37525 [Nostoc sp.]
MTLIAFSLELIEWVPPEEVGDRVQKTKCGESDRGKSGKRRYRAC